MAWSVDARVAVRFGGVGDAGEGDALLVEGGVPDGLTGEGFEVSVGHVAGCACCVPQSAAAAALARLFQRRARGEVPFFRRVVAVTATEAGDMAVWAAIRSDAVASARFRLEER